MKKLITLLHFVLLFSLNITSQASVNFPSKTKGIWHYNDISTWNSHKDTTRSPVLKSNLPSSTIPILMSGSIQDTLGIKISLESQSTTSTKNKHIVQEFPDTIKVGQGQGQNYTTLTASNGLFAALNAGSISKNIVVIITSDITEPGSTSLNLINETGSNAGSLSLTIKSDGNPHIISGTQVTDMGAMISIYGTKRLKIDGGKAKLLTFRNTKSISDHVGAVFQFNNSSQYDTITNCIIESNSTIANYGAIRIYNIGVNNVTISNNEIRDARGGTIGSPTNGIYSFSENNTLNICNNNIYNLKNTNSYGMYLLNVSNGCKIIGNNIYLENGVSALGSFTGIWIGSNNNHLVSGNYIGGSAPMCSGNPFIISGSGTFTGIYYKSNGSPAGNIQGNTIHNIVMKGKTSVFFGINYEIGPITISDNIIGSATVSNSIRIAGTETSAGIMNTVSGTNISCTIDKNTIANISLTDLTGSPTFRAIRIYGGTARMNKIFNIGSMNATLSPKIYGIANENRITTYKFLNNISNNSISLNGGNSTNPSLFGFYDNSPNDTTIFSYNSINLYGNSSTGSNNNFGYFRENGGINILNNNILVNSRTGGTGIHYAIYSAFAPNFVSDYNDLFVAGTILGHFGDASAENDRTNLAAWKTATNQDAHSISGDPLFTGRTNLLPLDSSPVLGLGTPVTGITTDIVNKPRSITSPTIGAYEIVCINPTNGGTIAADQEIWNRTPDLLTNIASASGYSGTLEYKWQRSVSPFTSWSDIPASDASIYQPGLIEQTTKFKRLARTTCMSTWEGAVESNIITISVAKNKWRGTVSNNWDDPANWSQNIVPVSDIDLIFDETVQKDCQQNSDIIVNDITNNQSSHHLITNGKSLAIKGSLNSNQTPFIDASSTNSVIAFTGEIAQTIPSGVFVNNNVYNMIIDNSHGVTLNTDLTISNLLSINSGKKLIIQTEKLLNVSGTIHNNAGTSGLIIKASPDGTSPNGSFIFHNALSEDCYVPASVEMFSKASQVNGSYKWQFFGIPLKSIQAYPTFNGSYVREMHENVTGTAGHWVQLQNGSVLTSFTGYEITQETGRIINFEGYLENADYGPISLSYTTNATYKGQHLIGNPYTAAINIKNDITPSNSITFGEGMDKTVYLYNTGSKEDWYGNGSCGGGDSNSAGQYLSIPQEHAGSDLLPPSIPSMQAFLVMVNTPGDNATISIPYNSVGTVVKNTTLQRAGATEKVFTRIDVNGNSSGDRMWIFIEPTSTRGFDNGWDGYKLTGSIMSPQLYAIEPDGYYQVNSIDNLNNTSLGFKAGTDTTYTLTFTHQNISNLYRNIYLTDYNENKTFEITSTGSQYSFNSIPGETNDNRFKIIAIPNGTDILTDIKTNKEYCNQINIFKTKDAILVNNKSNQPGELYIYDTIGRFIQKLRFNAGIITTLQTNLPAGTYILKAITVVEEFTTSLIVRE